MKRKQKVTGATALLLATALLAAACGSQSGSADETTKKDKGTGAPAISDAPVTLTAAIDSVIIDPALEKLIKDKLQKQHPNITLNIIQPVKGSTLDELIASGTVPDIVFTYSGRLTAFQEKGILYDITELVKTHKVDLSRFEPQMIADTKVGSPNGELYGLPYSRNFHAFYYNKDIFDKFGVPYPQDGMTWEQILELAKKVTRNEGGTQYRGIDPGSGISWIYQPLGIEADDYKTGKATLNNDKWKRVFELVKAMFTIPGNEPRGNAIDNFLKEKILAMIMYTNMFSQLEGPTKEGFNWDIAQYPSYTERPNIYGNASVNIMTVTKTSKYKDQAMQVIEAAISDDVQLESSRQGRISPLLSPQIQAEFGQNLDILKGKRIASIFKSKPVPYPNSSPYRSKSEAIAKTYFNQYLAGTIDVNTALSKGDEEINKMLQAEKAKQ
ncbi:ABC transporter substrate-binding protein [Paenibacillus ginsengarvi]|uniref:ABC transporter substrate-binding protein n=1 Tax=Paenibacillus ginsengarvi TaxID=400777 RepID=UPI0013150686|nr:extracellular solute-binding protein [Paenibacillus ginsengarvi]